MAPKGSFSVHFRTSPGIWPRAPPGAHLECPESSFGTPRELICGRTGAHFLKIGAHVCVHGTARCAGSLRTRRSNTSQSPCSPSYLVAHTAPRSSSLGAQQLCSRHHLTELPLQASQVTDVTAARTPMLEIQEWSKGGELEGGEPDLT